jgi:hypothetical protein
LATIGRDGLQGARELGAALHGNLPPDFSAQMESTAALVARSKGPGTMFLKIFSGFDCVGVASTTPGNSHGQPSGLVIRFVRRVLRMSRGEKVQGRQGRRWVFSMDRRWVAMQQNPAGCSGNAANMRRCWCAGTLCPPNRPDLPHLSHAAISRDAHSLNVPENKRPQTSNTAFSLLPQGERKSQGASLAAAVSVPESGSTSNAKDAPPNGGREKFSGSLNFGAGSVCANALAGACREMRRLTHGRAEESSMSRA